MGMLRTVGALTWSDGSTAIWYYHDGKGNAYAEVRRVGPRPDDPETRFRIGGPLVAEGRDFATLEDARRAVEELEKAER
jgi:hypothetical protein